MKQITVDYMARVEGEASIDVKVDGGPEIKLRIFEPPRFFESFLVGRKYYEVGDIVSRICGICPVSHMTTAIQAVEAAMGVNVSNQTKILRRILSLSQIAASHLVHLYMLAMPDYCGFGGIVGMQDRFKDQVVNLMRMKETLNELTGLIGGRALHPVTHLPGGFTAVPSNDSFYNILNDLKALRPLAKQVIRDVSKWKVSDFHCDSEYAAIDADGQYAVNEGRIVSTKGLCIDAEDYRQAFEESETGYAFAKKSIIKGRASFMVGALARLNNKFDKLNDSTKKLAHEIGLRVPCDNPFYNNLAQSLELADCIETCIRLIESNQFNDEDIHVDVKAGSGGSVTEAPRGLLYHWYRIDAKGFVEQANIVTPTSHNFQNIEKDLMQIVYENRDKDIDHIRLVCEQLVRAYDPCFSCSVH